MLPFSETIMFTSTLCKKHKDSFAFKDKAVSVLGFYSALEVYLPSLNIMTYNAGDN